MVDRARPGLRKDRPGASPAGVNSPSGIGPPVRSHPGTACRLRPLRPLVETRQPQPALTGRLRSLSVNAMGEGKRLD